MQFSTAEKDASKAKHLSVMAECAKIFQGNAAS